MSCRISIWREQDRVPVDDIVGMFIDGERPSIPGCEVLQQLNPGSGGAAQCSDPQAGAEYVVQVFLLGSVVLALARHTQPKHVPIELKAGIGVPYHNRSVIDTEEQLVGRPVPFLS